MGVVPLSCLGFIFVFATDFFRREDCVVGVLAVGRTPLVRKLLESETARTCWRQPGQPADAVNQELRKKRESSRIPSRKRCSCSDSPLSLSEAGEQTHSAAEGTL
nr:transmembrane protein 229B isoform X3 [Columba livia]